MKKTAILLVLMVFITACSNQILNLSYAKRDVQNYYESGQYDREMDEIITGAIKKFENMKFEENSAVVLDIDETALANYPHIKSMGFGSENRAWDEWTSSAKAKAIPQVKKLYDFLVSKGVKIFFITGRDVKYYEPTRQNLINAGYTKIDTLICRSKEEKNITAVQYKAAHRAALVNKGAKIIANVGDQWSDLKGGNSGIIIKLPNCLYVLD